MSSHISKVEILPSGILAIVVTPSGTQLVHRMSVAPGDDLAAAKQALDSSLAGLGYSAVDADAWTRMVVSITAVVWTTECIAAYRRKQMTEIVSLS